MNNYIKYALVNNKKYKINTDFRVALKCNEVSESDISEEERALAIIYLLFGDDGLNNPDDWQKLLRVAVKYLNINKENNNGDKEVNMSFDEDSAVIHRMATLGTCVLDPTRTMALIPAILQG